MKSLHLNCNTCIAYSQKVWPDPKGKKLLNSGWVDVWLVGLTGWVDVWLVGLIGWVDVWVKWV